MGKVEVCSRQEHIGKAYTKPNDNWLHSAIAKNVLRDYKYDFTLMKDKKALEKKVTDAFDDAATWYLEQQKARMVKQMVYQLNKYALWERAYHGSHIITSDQQVEVSFDGPAKITVNALIERPDIIEAVSYSWSSPWLTSNSTARDPKDREDKLPRNSEKLAKLQLAGENLLADLGIKTKKPVYGSIYHLKSRNAKEEENGFEERPELNIISYCFTAKEIKDCEARFIAQKSAVVTSMEGSSACYVCRRKRFCDEKQPPHKLEEAAEMVIIPRNKLQFTKSQEKILYKTRGEMKVEAVAGSGKTTIMVIRCCDLAEAGEGNILVITFTEKACQEFRDRLKSYQEGSYKGVDLSHVKVMTFNGYGQEILNEKFKVLGFTEPPKVLDDMKKIGILSNLIDDYGNLPIDDSAYRQPYMSTPNFQGSVKHLYAVVDSLKAAHAKTWIDVQEVFKKSSTIRFSKPVSYLTEQDFRTYLEIYEKYNAVLTAENLIDYEDQLRLLLELRDMGELENSQYDHIIVDEFQDSNPNQIEIVAELKKSKNFKSLAVVGDGNQAIYAFRNATKEIFDSVDKVFPNIKNMPLADNFRSDNRINQFANCMIDVMDPASSTRIISHGTDGYYPYLKFLKKGAEGEEEEQNLFITQIKKLIDDGTSPGDIAILARTRTELIKYQAALDDAGIENVLKVPKIIGDEPYPDAIISLAHFIDNNDDTEDLAYYVKYMEEDFDIDTDEALVEQYKATIIDGLNSCANEQERIRYFFDLIKPLREDYIGDAFAKKLEDGLFFTLSMITDFCVKYRMYGIKDQISSARADIDAVNLITIHSAKGLEWDTVLLSGKKFRNDAEEMRLMYVGVTRAKKRIIITHTDNQRPLARLWERPVKDDPKQYKRYIAAMHW